MRGSVEQGLILYIDWDLLRTRNSQKNFVIKARRHIRDEFSHHVQIDGAAAYNVFFAVFAISSNKASYLENL